MVCLLLQQFHSVFDLYKQLERQHFKSGFTRAPVSVPSSPPLPASSSVVQVFGEVRSPLKNGGQTNRTGRARGLSAQKDMVPQPETAKCFRTSK